MPSAKRYILCTNVYTYTYIYRHQAYIFVEFSFLIYIMISISVHPLNIQMNSTLSSTSSIFTISLLTFFSFESTTESNTKYVTECIEFCFEYAKMTNSLTQRFRTGNNQMTYVRFAPIFFVQFVTLSLSTILTILSRLMRDFRWGVIDLWTNNQSIYIYLFPCLW